MVAIATLIVNAQSLDWVVVVDYMLLLLLVQGADM
jgi:hypothetical protein